MRMKRTIRNRWVEALRSGKYQQATGTLTAITPAGKVGHCCLGVLTEIAVADGVEVLIATEPNHGTMRKVAGVRADAVRMYDSEDAYPPLAVAQWAGTGDGPDWQVLTETSEPEYEDFTEVCLATMNDGGSSFEYIAGLIEFDLGAADDERDDLDAAVQS